MSDDLRRLLDDAPSAELRAALESGLRDRASPRALGRAAAALGVGAASLQAARAAAASTGAARASLGVVLAKWGATAVLLGGAAMSPWLLDAAVPPTTSVSRPRAASTPSAHAPSSAPSSAGPTRVAPILSPLPWPKAELAPRSVASAATPTRRSGRPEARIPPSTAPTTVATPHDAPAKAPADLLSEEVALLDAARAALLRRDPSLALVSLDRHARLGGVSLGAEATLLRVQALVQSGRSAEARALARAALGGKAGRAYAGRLRDAAQGDE